MSDNSIIEIQDVVRQFRRMTAIDGVSLTINKGELFGILGPDGAGKTTLLRMMAAVMNPTAGNITIGEADTVKDAETVKTMIGYMPQRFGLYGDLSVEENINFVADVFEVKGQERQDRIKRLYEFTQLEKFKRRRAEHLSGGMKKKLGLACSLIHRPKVLLLDEPTTGVDPVARRDFWDLLSGLHGDGTTTVVSTPYMDEAERCNRVALLFEGHVLACDTPQNIKASIPGTVLALECDNIRQSQILLKDLPFLLDMQTYGDQLNLIISGDVGSAQQAIKEKLHETQINVKRLDVVTIRMEEAFIYLVGQARKEASI
jgi:ABC-2 type transport system ATP-binding protein